MNAYESNPANLEDQLILRVGYQKDLTWEEFFQAR
jgi:hypothetical protein